MSCMLSAPPPGELMNICARWGPAGWSGGKYGVPCSTSPVAFVQLSRNAAWKCATAGPSMRKWVSRQCSGPLRVAEPLVGDADAAGEAHPAVDHEELAVRAVVQPPDRVPARLVVAAQLDARGLHLLQIRLVDLAAADPVDQDVDAHPGPGPLGERVRERLADRARPVDVCLEGDRLPRGADRVEHRREDLIAVEERPPPDCRRSAAVRA